LVGSSLGGQNGTSWGRPALRGHSAVRSADAGTAACLDSAGQCRRPTARPGRAKLRVGVRRKPRPSSLERTTVGKAIAVADSGCPGTAYPEALARGPRAGGARRAVTVLRTCNPVDFATSLLLNRRDVRGREIAAVPTRGQVVKACLHTFASALVRQAGSADARFDRVRCPRRRSAKSQLAVLGQRRRMRPVDTGPHAPGQEPKAFQLLRLTRAGPSGRDWRASVSCLP